MLGLEPPKGKNADINVKKESTDDVFAAMEASLFG